MSPVIRYDADGNEIRELAFEPDPLFDEDDERTLQELITVAARWDDEEIVERITVEELRKRHEALLALVIAARHARDNANDDCCAERVALGKAMETVWGRMESWRVAIWDY